MREVFAETKREREVVARVTGLQRQVFDVGRGVIGELSESDRKSVLHDVASGRWRGGDDMLRSYGSFRSNRAGVVGELDAYAVKVSEFIGAKQ